MKLLSDICGVCDPDGEWVASVEEFVDEVVVSEPVVGCILHNLELLTLGLERAVVLVFVHR